MRLKLAVMQRHRRAGRERDLAWTPEGGSLYFTPDEPVNGAPPGAYAMYTAKVALAREDLKPAERDELIKKHGYQAIERRE